MPVTYEQPKQNCNFNFDLFKERALKIIQSQYGRVHPLDIFDFSETKDTFRCVAYRENEDNIPSEQKVGEAVSAEGEKAVDNGKENEQAEREAAEKAALEATARIKALLEAGEDLTPEDTEIAQRLELIDAEGNTLYTLDEVLNASDVAMKLAAEYNVDLKQVEGTGAEGNITKPDVQKFIDDNNLVAPDKENADASSDEQQSQSE